MIRRSPPNELGQHDPLGCHRSLFEMVAKVSLVAMVAFAMVPRPSPRAVLTISWDLLPCTLAGGFRCDADAWTL